MCLEYGLILYLSALQRALSPLSSFQQTRSRFPTDVMTEALIDYCATEGVVLQGVYCPVIYAELIPVPVPVTVRFGGMACGVKNRQLA